MAIRFWIEAPYPHETVTSVVDRVCATYRIFPQQLYDQLSPGYVWPGKRPDLDRWIPPPLIEPLCEALGLTREQARASFTPVKDHLLAPRSRMGYCPRCFWEDLEARRTPYFRWQWACAFVTLCPHHGVPMCLWRTTSYNRRVLPQGWTSRPSTALTGMVLWMDDDLRLCDDTETAIRQRRGTLHMVSEFQHQAVCLAGTGRFRNPMFRGWNAFHASLEQVTLRPKGGETSITAARRPEFPVDGVFERPPQKWGATMAGRTLNSFYCCASPGMRRTLIYAALQGSQNTPAGMSADRSRPRNQMMEK